MVLEGTFLMESGTTCQVRALPTLKPAMLGSLALCCHVHPSKMDVRAQGASPQREFHILSFKKCLLNPNMYRALFWALGTE